jgi:type IV secretory pathway VirB2 component (pilin)
MLALNLTGTKEIVVYVVVIVVVVIGAVWYFGRWRSRY